MPNQTNPVYHYARRLAQPCCRSTDYCGREKSQGTEVKEAKLVNMDLTHPDYFCLLCDRMLGAAKPVRVRPDPRSQPTVYWIG